MTSFKRKFDRAKDKFSGEVKENAGKLTGNEQLELKGKIQSSQADLHQNMDIGERINEIKENIAGKINDKMDENKKKSHNKK